MRIPDLRNNSLKQRIPSAKEVVGYGLGSLDCGGTHILGRKDIVIPTEKLGGKKHENNLYSFETDKKILMRNFSLKVGQNSVCKLNYENFQKKSRRV
ncbi:hypothetical protein CEXT_519491 [Caerostris extrusa]|uniref:Uncharacterized protein n=1 Tax=Caerostris extrusa TaxID=172846 RepID=A0AAV4TB07_CAEEX|nr:hypothetical protein CEXT_519491 [Caerostris extrusa]